MVTCNPTNILSLTSLVVVVWLGICGPSVAHLVILAGMPRVVFQ